jgi:hypothetical protein
MTESTLSYSFHPNYSTLEMWITNLHHKTSEKNLHYKMFKSAKPIQKKNYDIENESAL